MGLNAATAIFFGDQYSQLFEPEAVTPEQFYGSAEVGLNGGERRLMAAILSDGVEAYIGYWCRFNRGQRSGDREALEWVECPDPSYVFSFDVVCESLGINPSYLRLGLKRYVTELERSNRRENAWQKIRRPRN